MAARTSSTVPAAEQWRKCTGVPVTAHSSMSRATITVSATDGRPGIPSRLDHAPSCMCPPPARVSSSACWATIAPGSDAAYSSARRITPALATQAPSSVKMRTPSAYSSPIGASCSPARPTVMQPDDTTSHSPAGGAGGEHRADDRGVVERGSRVGHRHDRGEPAARRGARAGLDGLRLLVARLAQVHVQIDEPRAHHTPRGVQHVSSSPAHQVGRDVDDVAVAHADVGTARARSSITRHR